MFGWFRKKSYPAATASSGNGIDVEAIQDAWDVVERFTHVVDKMDMLTVYDERHLFHSKARILDSCKIVLMMQRDMEGAEAVLVQASMLAQYQPDVGPIPVRSFMEGLAGTDVRAFPPEELFKAVREDASAARWFDLQGAVNADRDRIKAELLAIPSILNSFGKDPR